MPRFSSPLLWLSLVSCAASRPLPERPLVREVRIEGTRQIPAKEIEKRLLTRESSWWPLSEPQRFDESAWRSDLLRIERYYEAQGYYGTKVVEQEAVEVPGGISLRARVEEAPATLIQSVDLQGLEMLPEEHRQEVLADFPLVKGERFLEEDWRGLRDELRRRLLELGYVEAAVRGEVRVHPPSHEAVVELSFQVGQRYRFGEIRLSKEPSRVPAWRIIEQAAARYPRGDFYAQSVLERVQARVFQMGIFTSVSVAPGLVDREAATVPVLVDVREAAFHSVRAGGGVGLDQSRNEVRALAEYVDRNFLGGLRILRLRGRAGWAFIPNLYAVARGIEAEAPTQGPIARLLAELEQPRLFSPDWRLNASLDGERELEQAYASFSGRSRVGLAWKPHPAVTVQPSYSLELYSLSGPSPVAARTRVGLGCPAPCVLSYLEQRIAWDRRDDPVEPRRGYFLGLSLQEGGGPLGGSFTYLRVLPDARMYATVGEEGRLSFSARLSLGTLLHERGVESPIVTRFYAGGASSMRGFSHQRLSPILIAPLEQAEEGVAAQAVPIGGEGLIEASVELRYDVAEKWILAAFLDAGWVSPEPLSFTATGQLQYAVGGGVRYRTPIGPIRLDFAYRLPVGPALPAVQLPGAEAPFPVDRGCLGIGGFSRSAAGAPEGACALHITFGEAF
ncbi:MAG: BamA/TamA family outer membrane protein [Myxococcales bacterium]|nr:BamA/TamA family outer membrane protein [Myxococcales bacterium]